MFVREVVATSDLYQTVRIKLKLLRPLNPTNETRPILYSYHLTVLASEIVNSVHLSTFFEAFLWRLLIDERKTSIFREKCFVEKYDWCGAKKGHPEPTIQLLFLLPSPNCFKSFFINRQSRKFAFIDVEVKKVKSIKKTTHIFCLRGVWEGEARNLFPFRRVYNHLTWDLVGIQLIIVVSVKNFYTLNIANGTADRRHWVHWLIHHL